MSAPRSYPSSDGRRIVICDYNQLLQSVTGLLRMSGYAVFQAYDGLAAQELCLQLPSIDLLVLNTYGTGIDTGELVRRVRQDRRDFPVLHIGNSVPDSMPPDVPTLAEDFTSVGLLDAVATLINRTAKTP